MPEDDVLIVQQQDRVALLTIDNPPANALSLRVLEALAEALAALEAAGDVKVVVITGAGKTWFAGGADIRELSAARKLDGGRALAEQGQALCNRLARSRWPVIAAINGVAAGGGLELALACHLRVCSETARLSQPEINLGIMPGWGGTQRLPRLIGASRALRLILTGEFVDAVEAYGLGLVDQIVPADRLMEETSALAERIAQKSAPALTSALEALVTGVEMPLDAALRHEAELFVSLMATDDAGEGFQAFFEKRPPQFTDS